MVALRRWHETPANGSSRAWVYAEEVRVSTGFSSIPSEWASLPDELKSAGEQRLDAFALHTWPSKRFERVAYEVKVSRQDLMHELERPEKRAAGLALSNRFYFVITEDLLASLADRSWVPPECGLVTISKRHGRQTYRKAPWRDTPLPPFSFMLSLARNLQANNPEKIS